MYGAKDVGLVANESISGSHLGAQERSQLRCGKRGRIDRGSLILLLAARLPEFEEQGDEGILVLKAPVHGAHSDACPPCKVGHRDRVEILLPQQVFKGIHQLLAGLDGAGLGSRPGETV